MSDNSWADELLKIEKAGASGMPADEFTFTDGSNGGMDGFYFDLEMNKGVEDAARLPETKGLSGLPDGIVTTTEEPLGLAALMDSDDGPMLDDIILEEADGFDEEDIILSGMNEEEKLASLTNLNWLEDQVQDVDRLPQMPAIIQDLDSQWGSGQSTDGVFLVPNSNESGVPTVPSAKAASSDVKIAMMRASRRVHYGHNIKDIAAELVKVAGVKTTKNIIPHLQDDMGLAGKVFVRASAFPGLKHGKWTEQLKKVAKTALYVITDDPLIAAKSGKAMVASVPWDEAFAYYRPRLISAGYKVAAGNPKTVIRNAFLTGSVKQEPAETYKPVHTAPVASDAQVKKALASKPKVVVLKTAEEQAVEAKNKQALLKIAKWVKAEQLSHNDALRIHASGLSATGMLKAASQIMVATQHQAVYDGSGANLPKDAQMQRQAVLDSLESRQAALEADSKKKFMVYLAKKAKSGALTKAEVQKIAALNKPVVELQKIAAHAIKKAAELREIVLEDKETKKYAGVVQKQALHHKTTKPIDPFLARVMKVAGKENIKAGEILGMLKWAKQQMNEALAGKMLDGMLAGKFSKPLLKAASSLLKEVRDAHEGLAGFMYVDAEAYASPSGTTGCERGALKHRANAIKIVKAMDRCAGCVNANDNEVCQQYNKRLVAFNKADNEKLAARQKANIKLANAGDSEKTAALFDADEYNLQGQMTVGMDPEVSPEELGKVLFGGMEIE